jgi:hypothetical protein
MGRKLALFFTLLIGILLIGSAALANDQGVVHAGAFCASVGDTGHTSTGEAMTCAITDAQGQPYTQPRWRAVAANTGPLAFTGSFATYLAAGALIVILVGAYLSTKLPLRDVRSRWY